MPNRLILIETKFSKSGKERKIPMNAVLKDVFSELRKKKDSPIWVFFNKKTQKPIDWIKGSFTTTCKRAAIE